MTRRTIGVDLGTTYAVVAARTGGGRPQVIPNRHGQRKTRSIVAFPSGPPVVGEPAAGCPPGAVVRCVKEVVGDPSWRFRSGDRSYRPEEIVAMILARLAADAAAALGGPVTDAVLTVPASFDAAARRAVENAAGIAGLRVATILAEPTAAALAYAATVGGTVLVYALGGGAFDASVLRLRPDGVEALASRGDRALGGWDWDNALMRLLSRRLVAAGGPDLVRGSDADEAYLRGRAEAVKHRLSTAHRADAVLRRDAVAWRVPVTRAEFEAASGPLLDRTALLVRRTLADAGLDAGGLDRVLLVGDGTGMPMVRRMLRQTLGVPLDRSIRPDEVVALGAALLTPTLPTGRRPSPVEPAGATEPAGTAGATEPAGTAGGVPGVREVATLGLGVLARDAETGAVRNVVVVPAGARLPAEGRTTATTSEDGQTRALIEVTQGDSPRPGEVRVLGRQVVPLPAGPAGTPIEIACSYGADQLPYVAAIVAGRSTGPRPVRVDSAMTGPEVRAAADRLAALLSVDPPFR
ncbi:MAG TPA: Hsp70 family protein [Mycobacteriales bacterium]|nr:Hsp70 family protein [Mycobacteriales bacterium]